MSLIQKLMGRRQFLIATGVASGCALTCNKIAGLVKSPGFEASVAMAAEKTGTAGINATNNKCPNLLSPLKIRNVVLKNRIMHTPSPPHSSQGPENFPTDLFRRHYSNVAKNAGIVTVDMLFGTYPKTYSSSGGPGGAVGPQHYSDSSWEDIPPVHNYIRRLIEDIHCEGAFVNYIGQVGGGGDSAGGGMPGGGGQGGGQMPAGGGQGGMPGGASGGQGGMQSGGQGGMQGSQRQSSASSVDAVVEKAKKAEEMGFDVFMMQGSNTEAMKAIKQSTNLLILCKAMVGGGMGGMGGGGGMPSGGQGGGQMPSGGQGGMPSGTQQGQGVQGGIPSGMEQGQGGQQGGGMGGMMMGGPGGGTSTKKWNYDGARYDWNYGSNAPGVSNVNQPTEAECQQAVQVAKQLEGYADIMWIRDGRMEHPNSFTQDREKPFNLAYAEAVKKAGVNIVVCPTAGFHIPAQNELFIANGQTDMVGMTTPFFADPELVKKLTEGRIEDVVPCLMCHDCHGISRTKGPWFDSCNVNPQWAVPDYKLKNIPAPAISKKVAVIGGGPAGMKAAITAAERGHKVTLYEKSDSLGGLLQFTDYTQWKWTYKDFKDFLINQVKKKGIDVKLNTAATPEMIKSKGYDTVLVATGAEPVVSRMAGADAGNVFNILTVYSNKKSLGKNVVFIGAGRIGTECAIGMVKDGHKVTQIASGKDLIEEDCIGPHNMMNQIGILEAHPDYSCVLQATVKDITGGKVTYTDSTGKENTLQADSIVIYSGLKPRTDEAAKFAGAANQVLLLGDCTGKNGTIQKTIRSAYFMASQV